MSTGIYHIIARTADALEVELRRLASGEIATITAEDFKEITGEDFDEFADNGRRLIGEIAARVRCDIRAEGAQIFFTKS